MGLLDKRAADWTARDALGVWSATWIIDLLKIALIVPLFFTKSRPARTSAEIEQARREYARKLGRGFTD